MEEREAPHEVEMEVDADQARGEPTLQIPQMTVQPQVTRPIVMTPRLPQAAAAAAPAYVVVTPGEVFAAASVVPGVTVCCLGLKNVRILGVTVFLGAGLLLM